MLPGGQRLVLRPVTVEDVDDLAGWFGGLTLGEVYRRFFWVARPDRASLERMASVAERGGFGLVAVVSETSPGPGPIVGYAGYELLPSGDGELAIVVAPEWREWLGRLLLHALAEVAAMGGVPNLEGDVQLTNQPMLALARSFGGVFMPGGGRLSQRFVVGTRGSLPTWPGPHDRPRVLVESSSGRWCAERTAVASGLQVLVCPGPQERRCPALHGQVCALAASADAIVVAGATSDEHGAALMEAHRPQHTGVPVCVDAGDGRADVAVVERVAREHARRSDGWLGDH